MTAPLPDSAINVARAVAYKRLSEEKLADEIGELYKKAKVLKKLLEKARKEMSDRGLYSMVGDHWVVVKTVESQLRFYGEGVKQEMGEDWYEERRKPFDSISYIVIPKPANRPSTPAHDRSPARVAAEALFKGQN